MVGYAVVLVSGVGVRGTEAGRRCFPVVCLESGVVGWAWRFPSSEFWLGDTLSPPYPLTPSARFPLQERAKEHPRPRALYQSSALLNRQLHRTLRVQGSVARARAVGRHKPFEVRYTRV